MKVLQNVLVLVLAIAIVGLAYQFLRSSSLDNRISSTEKRVEENGTLIRNLEKDARDQGEAIQKQASEIAVHGQGLSEHGREIADVKKRLADAEKKIVDLAAASEESRGEIERSRGDLRKLRSEVDALNAQSADSQRRELLLEDLRKDLKRSLERSVELERRLLEIEKRLGIERPQP